MRARLVSCLVWIGLLLLLWGVGLSASKPAEAGKLAEQTPTPTIAAPVLIEPADGAVLPQPVVPQMWTFRWSALRGPCKCSIAIWNDGPGGAYLGEENIAPPRDYAYYYTTYSPLPDAALEGWYWKVWVTCPYGSNESETRSFSVERAPTPTATARTLLPLLWKLAP